MSFANMKKQRSAAMEKLLGAAATASAPNNKSYKDDRIWKPTVDKTGGGMATIRFMPAAENESESWIQYWDHGFQGPTGRWYIERSLTSLGQDDPLSEMNSTLWATGDDKNKDIVRKRKRRLHYVSNVLIVDDPSNPANNGKVMLYVYGKKIFDKILDAMQPEFADEDPINPFDFWEGADFKLKIRKVEGWQNYDKSEFSKPKPVADNDGDIEAIYNQLYSLAEFNDPKNYKTYAELKAKLVQVLGEEDALNTAEQVSLDDVVEAPTMRSTEASSPSHTNATPAEQDDDDTLSYFNQLAAD